VNAGRKSSLRSILHNVSLRVIFSNQLPAVQTQLDGLFRIKAGSAVVDADEMSGRRLRVTEPVCGERMLNTGGSLLRMSAKSFMLKTKTKLDIQHIFLYFSIVAYKVRQKQIFISYRKEQACVQDWSWKNDAP
jgi:hypothetical protein